MSQFSSLEIAGRSIGPDHAPFVICELSGNHNGDLGRALAMIDAAAETGADAIKIQTYTADTITLDVDRPEFRIQGGLWDGRTLHDLYREAQTPYEWHPALFEQATKRGVILFSSPFDETAVDLLSGLDAPAYKIASFEAVDLPLIRYAAARGRPLIISTGMANEAEIAAARDAALGAARAADERGLRWQAVDRWRPGSAGRSGRGRQLPRAAIGAATPRLAVADQSDPVRARAGGLGAGRMRLHRRRRAGAGLAAQGEARRLIPAAEFFDR